MACDKWWYSTLTSIGKVTKKSVTFTIIKTYFISLTHLIIYVILHINSHSATPSCKLFPIHATYTKATKAQLYKVELPLSCMLGEENNNQNTKP